MFSEPLVVESIEWVPGFSVTSLYHWQNFYARFSASFIWCDIPYKFLLFLLSFPRSVLNVLYRTLHECKSFVPISLCWLSELNQYHCEWDKIKTKTGCFRNALRSKQEGFVQQQNHSIFQLESLVCNKFFMFRWDWMFLIQEFSSKIPLAGCRLLKFLW